MNTVSYLHFAIILKYMIRYVPSFPATHHHRHIMYNLKRKSEINSKNKKNVTYAQGASRRKGESILFLLPSNFFVIFLFFFHTESYLHLLVNKSVFLMNIFSQCVNIASTGPKVFQISSHIYKSTLTYNNYRKFKQYLKLNSFYK